MPYSLSTELIAASTYGHRMRTHRLRSITLAAICGTLLGSPRTADAQAAENGAPALVVETNLPAEGFISRYAAIDIRVRGEIPSGSRLAVFLGTTDATDVFRPVGEGLRYEPRVVPLPGGERELFLYRIGRDGTWEELHRVPLRVRGALGVDRGRVLPQLDLGLEGPVAEGHDRSTPDPDRSTYQDFTGQLALDGGMERGPVKWTSLASILGVSHRESALRFGTLGRDAPRVDLANYRLGMALGASELAIGHVSMGLHRHLIQGFSSRGATLTLRPVSRVELLAGMMSGSSIVGWANPVGLDDADHRLLSGTLALEALRRPGGLRLEVSGLSGAVRPLAGYNQGVVNDAEESRGVGLRLALSDPSQRLRLESGFSRSTFDNPADSTLAQGIGLVPVEEVTRNAHYVDVSFDVVRDAQVAARPAAVSVAARRERVDPLYRSLGAFAQADRESSQLELRVTTLGLALLGMHGRSRDNLDDVPSLLTSRTRRSGLTAEAPLSAVLGIASGWVPAISYGFDRTHQAGEGVPDDGEFSASHIPDQISRNHTLAAIWQLPELSFAYRLNHAFQDNRQAGREAADFATRVQSFTLGLLPMSGLSFDFSLDLERADNREQDQLDRTRRYGGRASWSPLRRSTLSLSVSHTRSRDEADLRRRDDTILDAHWSSLVPGLARLGARYYLRFSRASGSAVDAEAALDRSTRRWSLASGLNLGLSPFRP